MRLSEAKRSQLSPPQTNSCTRTTSTSWWCLSTTRLVGTAASSPLCWTAPRKNISPLGCRVLFSTNGPRISVIFCGFLPNQKLVSKQRHWLSRSPQKKRKCCQIHLQQQLQLECNLVVWWSNSDLLTLAGSGYAVGMWHKVNKSLPIQWRLYFQIPASAMETMPTTQGGSPVVLVPFHSNIHCFICVSFWREKNNTDFFLYITSDWCCMHWRFAVIVFNEHQSGLGWTLASWLL